MCEKHEVRKLWDIYGRAFNWYIFMCDIFNNPGVLFQGPLKTIYRTKKYFQCFLLYSNINFGDQNNNTKTHSYI